MGKLSTHDIELLFGRRVIDPMVEATPLDSVVNLTGPVGSDDDHWLLLGANRADFGNGHLEVRKAFNQESLELLVGPVKFIDAQHRWLVAWLVHRLQQGEPDQELSAKYFRGDLLIVGNDGRSYKPALPTCAG